MKNVKNDEQNSLNLFDIDFDLDFDLDDFDMIGGDFDDEHDPEPQQNVRILKPRIDMSTMPKFVAYENAEEFARQIDLTPHSRTFAWISGSFIFGDIVEALITARDVGIKKLYVSTLSMSAENIDSLRNVMDLMGDELESLTLIFSGYQYSHEKHTLIPYMYERLDTPDNKTQIAFGRWHNKIITMETVLGHTITIHGSANLRSSNSIEQIMVEVDEKELHQFNADIMDDIAEHFGTINHNAPIDKMKAIEFRQSWNVTSNAAKKSAERINTNKGK